MHPEDTSRYNQDTSGYVHVHVSDRKLYPHLIGAHRLISITATASYRVALLNTPRRSSRIPPLHTTLSWKSLLVLQNQTYRRAPAPSSDPHPRPTTPSSQDHSKATTGLRTIVSSRRRLSRRAAASVTCPAMRALLALAHPGFDNCSTGSSSAIGDVLPPQPP